MVDFFPLVAFFATLGAGALIGWAIRDLDELRSWFEQAVEVDRAGSGPLANAPDPSLGLFPDSEEPDLLVIRRWPRSDPRKALEEARRTHSG